MSTSLGMMLIARVLQGIGGGGMAPTEQSMFADTFPPEKRGAGVRLVRPDSRQRAGDRSGAGRLANRQPVLALGLSDQPAGRAAVADTGRACWSWSRRRCSRTGEALLAKGLNIDVLGLVLVFVGFGALQILLDRYEHR